MKKNRIITVQDIPVTITQTEIEDYVCITDIAFEFASAISPVFKLYLIKEFQRLKQEENDAHKAECLHSDLVNVVAEVRPYIQSQSTGFGAVTINDLLVKEFYITKRFWRILIMAFFQSAVGTLQTLVVALGAGLGIWGAINLMEGYGNDNPGAKSQGMK